MLLPSNLSTELVDRAAAVTAEASSRATADNTLSNNLSTELVDRAAAVSTLTDNLSSELVNRAQGDTNEQTARISADNTLSTNLSSEVADRSSAVSTLSTDVKSYIDDRAAGLDPKESVKVASTGNVDISSGPGSLDGVTLSTGDRVLFKDQTTSSQNGVYTKNANGSFSRATDMDNDPVGEVSAGAFFFVEDGTHANQGFVVSKLADNFSELLLLPLFNSVLLLQCGDAITISSNQ